jgi:hypothetical protein
MVQTGFTGVPDVLDGEHNALEAHSTQPHPEEMVSGLGIRYRALMDPAAPRSGQVEVSLRDGRKVSHFTRHAPGSKENRLDTHGVMAKARSLMVPVLGAAKAEALIQHVNTLEELRSVRELVPLLAG